MNTINLSGELCGAIVPNNMDRVVFSCWLSTIYLHDMTFREFWLKNKRTVCTDLFDFYETRSSFALILL